MYVLLKKMVAYYVTTVSPLLAIITIAILIPYHSVFFFWEKIQPNFSLVPCMKKIANTSPFKLIVQNEDHIIWTQKDNRIVLSQFSAGVTYFWLSYNDGLTVGMSLSKNWKIANKIIMLCKFNSDHTPFYNT